MDESPLILVFIIVTRIKGGCSPQLYRPQYYYDCVAALIIIMIDNNLSGAVTRSLSQKQQNFTLNLLE